MSHEHTWVLAYVTYQTYTEGPRHAISDDEAETMVRGVQFYRCVCGERSSRIVSGLVPGTEPHPAPRSEVPRIAP